MNLDRLNNGEAIAGVSAILLFVFMFFDWFGVESSDDSIALFSIGHNAWDALDYIPIVLLVTIIAALTVAGLSFASAVHRSPVSGNAVVAVLGIVSALLILYRIVDPPNFGYLPTSFGPVTYEGTVQFPIFLALLAATGIAIGGCRAVLIDGVPGAYLRAGRHRG